jgi:hypothetical protein
LGILNAYAIIIIVFCSSFILLSDPTGRQKGEVAFYVITVGLMCVLTGAITVLLTADDSKFTRDWGAAHIVNAGLYFIGGACLYFSCSTSRAFIALHSEQQISTHMQRSAAVAVGAVGPIVFLFAEAAGCYSTEDKPVDCDRLGQTNWTTVLQLVCSAVFYLGSEINNQHLTQENRIALSSVDAGFVVRQERLLPRNNTNVLTPFPQAAPTTSDVGGGDSRLRFSAARHHARERRDCG